MIHPDPNINLWTGRNQTAKWFFVDPLAPSVKKKAALYCHISVPSHFSVSRRDQMKALTALFRGRRLHKWTSALLFSPWFWPEDLWKCHVYTAPLFSFIFSASACLLSACVWFVYLCTPYIFLSTLLLYIGRFVAATMLTHTSNSII